MAFSRAAALRSTLRATRPSSFARPQVWRQAARRGYASGGHGAAKAGGDAVWAAGAVAVTVPSCWYLIANGPDTSHHGGHDEHGESHHEEKEEDESKEEDTEEKSEDGERADDQDSEKSNESDSDDAKDADTPETSDDEGEDKDEKKSEGGDGKNSKESVPDAKGGSKKRISSSNAIKQGESDDSEDPDDKAAASKSAGSKNTQSGKQEGLSNTDTKHSTDIQNSPEKSKKGEGSPETAKSKGTVQVDRPQPDSKKK